MSAGPEIKRCFLQCYKWDRSQTPTLFITESSDIDSIKKFTAKKATYSDNFLASFCGRSDVKK